MDSNPRSRFTYSPFRTPSCRLRDGPVRQNGNHPFATGYRAFEARFRRRVYRATGKQAKVLSDKQVRAVLAELDTQRYPLRDRMMLLLSIKAGMRAVEIASITWAMVTDAEGEICDVIALENRASKGKVG